MNKIITKILIAIILCSLMAGVSIGYLSLRNASKILRQEAHDKLGYISSNYANNFSTTLKKVEGSVDTLASIIATSFDSNQFATDDTYRTAYMKRIDKMLKEMGNKSVGIQGLYIIINPELTGEVFESWFISDGKGKFVYQAPEDISMFYPQNKDMAWYYEPINKKKGVWLPPYVDATINIKMISYTKAIFNDDRLVGVAGIDIAFEDIERTIGAMKVYESGYAFLTNTDLAILLHPTLKTGTYLPNIENEDLNNVVDSMIKNKSDVIEYVFKKKKKVMGFSKLSNGWILGVTTVAADILKPIDRQKNNILISVIVLLIVTCIIGLFISKSITAPIKRLMDKAALISQGQHDIELDLKSKDEIGELSKSIHIMAAKLITSHENLKESEKKYRTLFDSSTDAITIVDASTGKYIDANKAALKIHDVRHKNDIIGASPDIFSPECQPNGEPSDKLAERYIKEAFNAGNHIFEWMHCKRDKKPFPTMVTLSAMVLETKQLVMAIVRDISEQKNSEREREKLIADLQKAVGEIKTLSGLVPICASCKKIRDDKGYWNNLESYIEKHSDAAFSHGICPECSDRIYGDEEWYKKMKESQKKE